MSPRKPSSNKTMAPPECRAGLGSCFDQPWFAPSLIFVLALVLRLIYVSQTRGTPFFETLGLDARFYDQWARRLAAGEGYGEPFFMSPLYPYFLAGLYRLFGRDLFLVRVVQSVIGAGSAALTYLLARDLFDSRAGLIAGLVTACYGALIFYDGSVVMTPLLVFLNLLSLFLLARSERIGGVLFPMAAGFTLGLAAIGRAAALLFVPLAVAWIVWARGRAGTKSAPRPADARSGREGPREASGASASPATAGWRMAALYVLGILLVIAPITTRNYAVSGDFIPITSNGGLNFYIGNGDIATGGYAKPEGLDIVEDPGGELIAEAELGRDLTPSEISSYWYSRAWSHIGGDPGAWAGLLIRKLSFALGSYEFPQLENYEFQRRYSTLLSLPLPGFGVVAPLGLLGLGLAFRRRRGSLLGLFFIAYVMSIVVFFVLARYRLPAVPALAIGASHAAVVAYDRLRARAFRSVAWFAVALLALGFL